MRLDIEPCPFCGGLRAELAPRHPEYNEMVWVKCHECGAEGPKVRNDKLSSEGAAVVRWNNAIRPRNIDPTEAVRKLIEPYSESIAEQKEELTKLKDELAEFEPVDASGTRLHIGDPVVYSGGETGVVEGFLMQVSVKLRDGRSILDIGEELYKEDAPTLADVVDDLLEQMEAKSPEHFDMWLDEIREAVRREG